MGAAKVSGFRIVLPHEQHPNPFVTPELSFQLHDFSMRKMRFQLRAKALLADRMADPLTPSLVVPAAAAAGAFALTRYGWRQRQTYRALAEHREVLIAGREPRLAGLRDPEALRARFERGRIRRILRVEALLAPESLAALWQECEAIRASAERSYIQRRQKGGTLLLRGHPWRRPGLPGLLTCTRF